MRWNTLISPLVLLPLYAFSQSNNNSETMKFYQNPINNNSIVKHYSNESKKNIELNTLTRTIDYPTQVIRIKGNMTELQLTCEQVNDQIEKTLLDHITSDKFTYNTFIYCSYDPETRYATQFGINSYFDPLSDVAVDYLKTFLAEYNDSDLMGTKLQIESAKGLIVAFNLTAGTKKNPDTPPFVVYRQDRSNYFFKSNYAMRSQLLPDIYDNFFSNDPEKVLPFLDRWLFSHAGNLYKAVLRDSNYVELQPEKIFLMEHGADIFVSSLRHYFNHNCSKYENHRCLKNG
ncbi:MAG: Lpg0189 family type II secretion system effector [Legionellales bacterium]